MTEETQATTETIQTYPASAVVNYMIDNAKKYNVILTPMKLQKLLYYANGWSWAFYNKPLISDKFKAWEYSPVYPEVYHELKDFGSKEITNDRKILKMVMTNGNYKTIEQQIDSQDLLAQDLINNILKSYGKKDGLALSNWTHINVEDNPWRKAITDGTGIVADEDIKRYFDRLSREGKLA
jgi:uncharacterized phage-associated protein